MPFVDSIVAAITQINGRLVGKNRLFDLPNYLTEISYIAFGQSWSAQ
jgi:hypothetical protein